MSNSLATHVPVKARKSVRKALEKVHYRRAATAAERAAVLEQFYRELGHDLPLDERIERARRTRCGHRRGHRGPR